MNHQKKPIILFGGTFDPVHYGHLILAQRALEFVDAQKVIFIPCYSPPHKLGYKLTHWKHRLEMLKLAISTSTKFEISTFELERKKISYTYITVDEFCKIYKDIKLYFLIGLDSLLTLTTWENWEKIVSKIDFLVGERIVEQKLAQPYNKLFVNGKIIFFPSPKIEISSSEIRTRVKKGLSIKFLLPQEVEEYILRKKIYQK